MTQRGRSDSAAPEVWVNPRTGGVESTAEWQRRLNAGDPEAHRQLAELARGGPEPSDVSPPREPMGPDKASTNRDQERLEAGMFAAAALASSMDITFDQGLALMIRVWIRAHFPEAEEALWGTSR